MKFSGLFSFPGLLAVAATPLRALLPTGVPSLAQQYASVSRQLNDPIYQRFSQAGPGLFSSTHVPIISTQKLTSENVATAMRVKRRYGPFTLISAKSQNLFSMLTRTKGETMILNKIDLPCTDCTVLTAKFNVEYEDGRVPEPANGAYLHHAVILANGKDRATIGNPCMSMGPAGVSTFAGHGGDAMGETYGVGWYPQDNGTFKAGYRLLLEYNMLLNLQMTNYDDAAKKVYLVLDMEYLPGAPKDYYNINQILLTARDCSHFQFTDLKGKSRFVGQGWTWPWDGHIVNMVGHLHDGGTSVEFLHNDKLLCDSKAEYKAAKADSVKAHVEGEKDMISSMSSCEPLSPMKKGEKFSIVANFDVDEHPLRKNPDGRPDEAMALSILFLAHPMVK